MDRQSRLRSLAEKIEARAADPAMTEAQRAEAQRQAHNGRVMADILDRKSAPSAT
ncbi:hypothetical protein J2848_005384 [Azospirillum lipoferum]|uniref:hypothetical protein n=1 Tax=Azospirillum TaxID=191 RepID=UPI00147857E4|nr:MULTISPECIES: hypothetical protein [Azospirillum]MCP1613688.1 hypothetical protein [Azospirillum lipoferum]MDW5532449.1 hypothetical protein [Azospirillum sp. NL1]